MTKSDLDIGATPAWRATAAAQQAWRCGCSRWAGATLLSDARCPIRRGWALSWKIDGLQRKPSNKWSVQLLFLACTCLISAAAQVGTDGAVMALDIQRKMLVQVERAARENRLSNVRTVLIGVGQGKFKERNREGGGEVVSH